MKVNTITNNNFKPSFKGFCNNKMLLNTLKFAAENGSLFSASVSMALSLAVRPAAILATPKTDKENKKYACAKSVSSSLVGYLIMLGASLPVAKAVKKIDNAPQKYLKPETIENLKNGAKLLSKSQSYMFATQMFKLGLGLVMAIPKSFLTCALIPPLMLLLFPKKKQPVNEGVSRSSKVISFKGVYNTAAEGLAKGFGKIIDTKPMRKIANKFYDTNFAQHIMSATDILLTLSFVNQTAKSKKIKQERKKPLIYNSAISTGLCIAGGYALNSALKKPEEKFIHKFKEANRNLPDIEKYIEGIKIAKPVLILGGIYYILIPVIATFLADRADNGIGDIKK